MNLLVAILGGVALWAAGTLFFDVVHWLLHAMLRSPYPAVRAFAWPHAVHHEWLDRDLNIHFDLQWKNVVCHIVPEYLTQVAFCGFAALFLPRSVVLACLGMQSVVFLGLLYFRGLDINHRAIAILDAHRPSVFALPQYHALHHVYPDAHYSAYSKVVDWVVGGGLQVSARRFVICGDATVTNTALARSIKSVGGVVRRLGGPDTGMLDRADVVILAPEVAPDSNLIEVFLGVAATRPLPPEVWDLRAETPDQACRFYHDDPRVIYRRVLSPCIADAREAERFARRTLFWLRRGVHFLPPSLLRAPMAWLRFRRLAGSPPQGAQIVRSRKWLQSPAG